MKNMLALFPYLILTSLCAQVWKCSVENLEKELISFQNVKELTMNSDVQVPKHEFV